MAARQLDINGTVKPVQDIVVPPKPSVPENLLEKEVEHDIPVKAPGHSETPNTLTAQNPVSSAKQLADDQDDDAELDNILKDVNQKVKDDEGSESAKGQKLKKKLLAKSQKSKIENASKKPILIVAAAIIVALGLSGAAVYAFKQSNNSPAKSAQSNAASTVGTSAESSDAVKAAGGALITPGDLTDLSSAINSKLNGLNDAQDFNTKDLADQSLGL